MSVDDIRSAAERVKAEGKSKPRVGRHPVNQPMVDHWLDAIGDLMRDPRPVERVGNLAGFPQIEVAIQQGHRRAAVMQGQEADQPERQDRDEPQRAKLHRAQGAQPGQNRRHAPHRCAFLAMAGVWRPTALRKVNGPAKPA